MAVKELTKIDSDSGAVIACILSMEQDIVTLQTEMHQAESSTLHPYTERSRRLFYKTQQLISQ